MTDPIVAKLRALVSTLNDAADEAVQQQRQLRADTSGIYDPETISRMVANSGGFRDGLRYAAQLVHDLMLELEPINPIASVATETWTANASIERQLAVAEHTLTMHQFVRGDQMDFRVSCSCGWVHPDPFRSDDYPAGDWETDPGGADEAAMNAAWSAGQAHVVQATT